jgi:hypothetical protein
MMNICVLVVFYIGWRWKIIKRTVFTKEMLYHLLVDVIHDIKQLISHFIILVMTDIGTDRKCINITIPKINVLLAKCKVHNAMKVQKKQC